MAYLFTELALKIISLEALRKDCFSCLSKSSDRSGLHDPIGLESCQLVPSEKAAAYAAVYASDHLIKIKGF